MTKYLCINCKLLVDKIPKPKNNECIAGYDHTFIDSDSIINKKDRLRLSEDS